MMLPGELPCNIVLTKSGVIFLSEVGSNSSVVTYERRKKFADTLKKKGISRASQITKDVQVELFNLCESAAERCALRRFLTHDYRMSIEPGGILTEKEFADATASHKQVSIAVHETVGASA